VKQLQTDIESEDPWIARLASQTVSSQKLWQSLMTRVVVAIEKSKETEDAEDAESTISYRHVIGSAGVPSTTKISRMAATFRIRKYRQRERGTWRLPARDSSGQWHTAAVKHSIRK
jgi:hypothetical protein